MFTTLEVQIEKRGKRLFIDFSQNDQADTLASVYSVRPGKQPTVSAPIEWEALYTSLSPTDFTIENMLARLQEKGDLWKDVYSSRIRSKNSKILKALLQYA